MSLLRLTAPEPLGGTGHVFLQLNGADLPLANWDPWTQEIVTNNFAVASVNFGDPVVFDAPDDVELALLGVSGKRTLTLHGVGFEEGVTYLAYLMEHTENGLEDEATVLQAAYVSPTKLTVSSARPTPWPAGGTRSTNSRWNSLPALERPSFVRRRTWLR